MNLIITSAMGTVRGIDYEVEILGDLLINVFDKQGN
jgi:hypothetical protein